MRDEELHLALRQEETIEPPESFEWLLWSIPEPCRGMGIRKIECPGFGPCRPGEGFGWPKKPHSDIPDDGFSRPS